jgi:hypothetical protein
MNPKFGRLGGGVLVSLVLLVTATSPGLAQDEIQYYDATSKVIVSVQANIEQETVGGLRFRTGARSEPVDVGADDLIDVVYSVPGSLRLILARARNEEKKTQAPGATWSERMQAIRQANKAYEELLDQGQIGTLKAARRHWQFRIARLRAQAAWEDPAERKRAVASLTDFLRDSDSWQTSAAFRLLAGCLLEIGDVDAIAPAGRQVLARKGLSPAAKREHSREAILWDCLGKHAKEASTMLTAQKAETPPGGSELLRLQALEALRDAAEDKPEKGLAQLESLEKQAKNGADRGFIWLLRGYCESVAGRDEQALWAFLRVEQLYGEDRVACALAVAQLAKLFESRSDWEKAALYRVKLWRDFAG